jgi:hypothetical protein
MVRVLLCILQYIRGLELRLITVTMGGANDLDLSSAISGSAANRLDDPKAEAPRSGKAFTASRIVVPLLGMADMLNKLQDFMGQLQAQGTIRQVHTPNITQRPN